MWEALAETSADDSHSLRVENRTPRCVKNIKNNSSSAYYKLFQKIIQLVLQPHFFEIQK